MFRRKEEGLFDNELNDAEESSFSVQPVAAGAPAQPATVVAASTASVQPIVRPASPVPPAATTVPFRSATVTTTQAANTPVSSISVPRSAEGKPMTTISSPNAAQSSIKPSNRVLTVGNDILLKGEIATCDRLVIEGKVEATLNDVHTVELAECGSFKGSANVVEAQISGLFEGDLVVTGRLVIYASGKVRGNVSYGEIEIERGGELSGQVKASGNPSASQALPKALQKAAA